ncbi:MAG: FAD-dependent oxidoreductase [Aestuariibacter sp.]
MSDTITLAGAGLVGSLLAVYLAKRGYQVEVFENRQDMRKVAISAGRSINLALANRGIHPLEEVGVMDDVRPSLITMKGRMIHDQQGNTNFQPYGQKPNEVIYSVSRAGLNKILMNAAESTGKVNFHFESQISAIDWQQSSLQVLSGVTKQTQSVNFEHLIGTDGAGSVVRKAILAQECEQDSIEPLGHCYKELNIPPGPNGEFQLEKEALHIWPRGGFMLIALPNPDASFTLTLFMPGEGKVSFAELDNEAKMLSFFEQQFPDVVPLISNLTQEFFENPTSKLATVRCAPWHYQGKGLILGDAAHAIVPFHGQGMNCGFEDCHDFNQCMDNFSSWEELFKSVAAIRKPNADAIADLALDNYIEMRDSVRDPNYLLQKQIAFQLEQWFPEQFTPRYSMVMFHRMPYAEAQALGEIHKRLLSELSADINSVDELDKERAKALLERYIK